MRISFYILQIFASLTALTALLTGCGGGGSGPAIQARPQSIQFATAPTLVLGGTATVQATASSALAVSYSSATPNVCIVHASTGVVTNLAVGTCVITADQSGDDTFAPAVQATQNLVVAFDPAQVITFGAAPSLTLFGSVMVSASTNSGLPTTYSSLTPAICTANSSTGSVTDITSGTCTIAADQAGNANYNAAPQVTQSFTVAAWPGPITVASSPTSVSATLGSVANTVQVSFNGPASSGGSQVTGYTVASTAGGLTASGSASPIMVVCPAACTGYAFAVQATNGIGPSAPSAAADVLTSFNVTARWFEPDTQPNDSIFTGSFTLNSTTQTVTGLAGSLTESMTGPPMVSVPLSFQLSSVSDGAGVLWVTSFALNTTDVFSEGGFAASSEGLYYGYPTATSPAAGGAGNSFATIVVNPANPTAALTPTQINKLAYGDCASGGMMGDTCMTGYSGIGTMGGYPVAQSITRQ
jgi:hypothetical protein